MRRVTQTKRLADTYWWDHSKILE